ncbi:MAG: hypothetical protein NC432_02200 [Roseburia sp.]|nr:hypothetical protein [Roseburia sp.]MCM1097497.1 hypothetical protein [Ruminococcus flavefaciens]
MNFREEYRSYNEEIRPDPALVGRLREAAREKGQQGPVRKLREAICEKGERRREQGSIRESREAICEKGERKKEQGSIRELREVAREKEAQKRKLRTVRRFAGAAAACLCILVGLPALAANVDPLYELMRRVSPKLAQSFRLVQKADEKQGIRMEVAAVYLQENELQAYITLEDLEGDRIDETTDLFNSYSVNAPCPSYGGGGWEPVDFDEETGKATFLVTLGLLPDSSGNPVNIAGKKITLYLRRILSGKTEYDNLRMDVPWSEVQADPEIAVMRISGGPAPDIIKGDVEDPRPSARLLKPGEATPIPGVEGILFTGMGYIDGRLHIQTAVLDYMENDNHCELYLIDQEGNQRYYDYKVSAKGNTAETEETMYQDCIFEISPEELEKYTLCGHFVTSGSCLEGNWSVTFPAEETSGEGE